MSNPLSKVCVRQLPGNLFQSAIDEKHLAIESRDDQLIFYSVFDLKNGDLVAELSPDIVTPWHGLHSMQDEFLILQYFENKKNPDSIKYFRLSLTDESFEEIQYEQGLHHEPRIPSIIIADTSEFETIQQFIGSKIVLGCEYDELGEYIFTSYYRQQSNGLSRHLMILHDGEEKYHEIQDSDLKGFAPGSFFTYQNRLIFVCGKKPKSIFMRFSPIAFLLLSSLVWANPVDSVRAEQRDGKWFVIHQVDAGETLYAIARRYKADVSSVISSNQIVDNSIQIGQMLSIPVKLEKVPAQTQVTSNSDKTVHEVQPGETLFAIARLYKVSVNDIKKWNSLTSESLSIGQELAINSKGASDIKKRDAPPFARGKKHYVQTGETLDKISVRRNVSTDSLMAWNKLRSDDIRIGQLLWYREYDRKGEDTKPKSYFGKITQEGIAMQIEDMAEADKYLALHKTLPTGTLLEVRNLMNNKKVFVRVVGQLPETGMNENVVIRITEKSFKRLGILDTRARVELTYYED